MPPGSFIISCCTEIRYAIIYREKERKLFMKQKLVNIVEKIVEIIIVLMGELIKNVCLLFAFGFCIEGKHLEMWIAVICGYTYEIIYYKTALKSNYKSKKHK